VAIACQPAGAAVLRRNQLWRLSHPHVDVRLEDHFLKNRFPFLSPAGEHFDVMVFHFCIAAGFTVGVACHSRWYFEEPFLRLKERLEAPSEESAAFQRAPQTQAAEDLRTA
jgi:hypothetical protein